MQSIHLINRNPSLSIIRQRQLLPYIRARPKPSTYQDAINSTVDSFSDAKRTLDWFFDVAGFQSSATDSHGIFSLADRKKLYQWVDNDTFPPHLETIPWADTTLTAEIFDFKRLYDTIVLMFHAYYVDLDGVEKLGPNGADTMQALEDRNRALHDAAAPGWFSSGNMFTAENIGLRDDWYTDTVFAQQHFTGTNPTTLTLASAQWMQVFTEAAAGNTAVLNLLATAPANSFYVQDYSYFRDTAGMKPTDEIATSTDGIVHFGCASVALFYLPPAGQIHPLAIILDWKGSLAASVAIFNKRVLPTDPTVNEKEDWPWRYAKTCVQVSDWSRHEITVHLTDTHFVEEVTVVAAQRTLPDDHIVYRLLKEHWTTTLSINSLARSILIPKVIMPLSAFTEAQLISFVNREYANFNWTGKYIPNDLETRGFPVAELETNPKYHNYGYGREIHLMWNTLRKFVAAILTQYYPNGDTQVKDDKDLAAFCAEMQSTLGGKMTSFPTVTTLDGHHGPGLIDMVTMCIHIASPQHTAVNYLQQYYMTFVPNKPSALYAPLPTSLRALQGYGEADLLNALPIKSGGQDQNWLLMAQVPYLLSPAVEEAVSLTTFARQAAADKDAIVARAGKTLVAELEALEKTFKGIGAELDDQTKKYEVLYPNDTAKAIVI